MQRYRWCLPSSLHVTACGVCAVFAASVRTRMHPRWAEFKLPFKIDNWDEQCNTLSTIVTSATRLRKVRRWYSLRTMGTVDFQLDRC